MAVLLTPIAGLAQPPAHGTAPATSVGTLAFPFERFPHYDGARSRSRGVDPASPVAAMHAVAPGTPRWVRWGLAGAGAGALAFPLLGSLASDSRGRPARDAAVGAVAGFVVIGGSVALWDALCAPGGRSRRWGLCGHP
ncbi:MAG: hypothetical protein ABIZ91_07780 [Gemmatimonadaceae bacterium]